MKYGYYSDNIPFLKINIDNLKWNIDLIKSRHLNTLYVKYLFKVYSKLEPLLNSSNSYIDIKDELFNYYGKDINNINNNVNSMDNYDLILSNTHESTYYLIKKLNSKKEDLTVICFDMHCDAYDENIPLWKGNHFSKLLQEKYISNLIVVGMPKYKIKMTYEQISNNYKDKVTIINKESVISLLKKYKPKRIMFSIDIDCFNSFKQNYTAIDYSPIKILNYFSKQKLDNNLSDEVLMEKVYDSIFIKNSFGRENLYKIGENYLTYNKFKKTINKVVKYSNQNGIKIGFQSNNNHIITDITELNGYDLNGLTLSLIINIINFIKEVS